MVSSIQLSEELKEELKRRKMSDNETYEEVIWDLIEDSLELSNETLKEIEIARKEFAEGKTASHEEIKTELDL